MPSITSPRFTSASPRLQPAPAKTLIFGRTMGQHMKLLATAKHPGAPVEVYPLFGICLFAITYIGVRFYQSKDVTDIKFFNTHDRTLPWASIPKNDGRDLSSVIARGDGIETRKFAYPKPKSFFSSKFEPDHYNQSASQ